jgi:multisubunit Na+/H+ antiporter MnhE subunit
VHALRRFLVWWVVLLALWMELVSSTDWSYLFVGLGTSAAAAGSALLAHHSMQQRYSLDRRWARWFVPAVGSIVGDTLRLTRLLFRPAAERSAGTLREVRLPREGPRRAAGRRALAVVVLGLAPGSYVVDVSGDRLLLHELPNSSGTLTDAVSST